MQTPQTVSVDIISDVMCPWCIVGFRQLEDALAATGLGATVRWHPFELNPDMAPAGENTTDHIMRKYGTTREQAKQNRQRLVELGASLGFAFNFTAESRMRNSFKAHQLLDFALSQGKQHPLKLALFSAHFSDGLNVSDQAVLLEVAKTVGLDAAQAKDVLEKETFASSVREKQALWQREGISGVPTMIFGGKFAVTGAQGAQNYAQILQRTLEEAA